MPQAVNNIDDSVVKYTPGQPEFAQLVSDTLGNAGSAADGFDAAMQAVTALFSSTDAAVNGLDQSVADLATAIENFNALDTSTWATAFPPPLMALKDAPQVPQPTQPGGAQIPSLPAPCNNPADCPPPAVCVPAPPPPAPPPPQVHKPLPPIITHTPSGSPCPPGQAWNFTTGNCQPLCPKGFDYTTDGQCTPSPVQTGGVPPAPPIQLPPVPQGLPPCGSGFAPSVSGGCVPLNGSDLESRVLLLLGDSLLQVASTEVAPTTAAWVASFTGVSLSTSFLLVTAIIGVVGLLVMLLGGGCGAACVDAALMEQVYEAIGDNLLHVARHGMISGPAAVVAITHFMGVGDLAMKRLGTQQALNGKANMDSVMTHLIALARKMPAAATTPIDLAAARRLYVYGAKWYQQSLDVADQVTTAFLTAMASAQASAPTG